jgi:pyruvate,water dikinase
MDGVAELLDAGTEYYTSVQAVIPIAAMSEIFFTAFYDQLVRRPGDPDPTTFVVGLDSEPLRAEKSLYDLAAWARTQPGLAEALLRGSAAQVLERSAAADDPLWTEWRRRFTEHLERYGHAIYNLDFANEVPADHPEPLVETVRFYLRGLGTDPRIRQQGLADRREEATRTVTARLDPVRRAVFTWLLSRAHALAPLREDALADVGLAWPRLRAMMLELGRRLVEAGVLAEADEVFWLHRDEILSRTPGAAERIEQRKQRWRGQRRVTPPGLLPRGAWFAAMQGLMPTGSEDQEGDVIVGIGASAGVVTATARVLGGPEDFGRLEPGDILVAVITTPAWTTLFARAAGVVTDVGGPLSHSSIVAREYGIPAVLGTAVATRRIKSGQRIRVDGTAGTVTLLDGEDAVGSEAAPAATAPPHRFPWGRVGVTALGATVVVWEIRRRLRRRTGDST